MSDELVPGDIVSIGKYGVDEAELNLEYEFSAVGPSMVWLVFVIYGHNFIKDDMSLWLDTDTQLIMIRPLIRINYKQNTGSVALATF